MNKGRSIGPTGRKHVALDKDVLVRLRRVIRLCGGVRPATLVLGVCEASLVNMIELGQAIPRIRDRVIAKLGEVEGELQPNKA
jgi:hypothetical protein